MSFNPNQQRVPKGQGGGGRFGGTPRDAKAAAAQKSVAAQKAGAQLAATAQNQRAAYLKSLSDADLQALTGLAYSSPSSDPAVVQMRLLIAAEMGKRGFDIKQYGALGGGPGKPGTTRKAPAGLPRRIVKPPAKKAAPAKAAPAAVAKKPAGPPARPNRTPKNA